METPVPTEVPPQEPSYHLQLPPVPKLPPVRVSVELWPLQMVDVPIIEVAGVEVSLTVMLMLLQTVVLQVPSARTK